MNEAILQAIIDGSPNLSLTVSAQDLRIIINEMVLNERERIKDEMARNYELPCLTRKQAAEKLGVHINTMLALEKRRELIPERVGSKLLYRQSDIDEYLSINKNCKR